MTLVMYGFKWATVNIHSFSETHFCFTDCCSLKEKWKTDLIIIIFLINRIILQMRTGEIN